MTFEEILARVWELLEREGRVAYRVLKRRFELDDDDLEDLKADLIDAKRVAIDEEGKVLVWVGGARPSAAVSESALAQSSLSVPVQTGRLQPAAQGAPEAERR